MDDSRADTAIASLLPSATEICVALGLQDRLVGRSHECDFPAGIERLPTLTRATVDSKASSIEIDRQVRGQLTDGLSLYQVEEQRLQSLRPNLVITQDTCDLCAVSFGTVQESVRRLLGTEAEIVSLSPTTLNDVLEDHRRVAVAAGVPAAGDRVVDHLRRGLDEVRDLVRGTHRVGGDKPKVLMLEWMDPPMTGGHWTPELLELVGAEAILGHVGRPTRAESWDRLADADPDVVLVAPCGFGIAQSRRELPQLLSRPALRRMRAVQSGNVFVVDGNHYFNRPGPRLLDTARIVATILHPHLADRLQAPAGSWRPAVP